MEQERVLVIEGSESDNPKTNEFLKILEACNVKYHALVASAHVHAGQDFFNFVASLPERFIVFIGGMSLVAPGIISRTRYNMGRYDTMVFGVPTDPEARSAVEVLPQGTFVLTSGLNTVSPTHGIQNNALAVAHFVFIVTGDTDIGEGLTAWYKNMKEKKPIKKFELDKDGLIPEKEKK
ncbi:MAG: AIR carboxylase family protein [Patescibacteria group bacterium]|nr:AIR carboxylase family protein [Patescibacteria group bacterium]MDD5294371.1 AIR carboxylase family protein [Patescibacteria group bacterium]MDD5554185.1 AIR carboxylase family protein [Patescibacteria group bacterium]